MCIFCKIVEGEIPNKTVLENDNFLCFEDLYPQAKHHVLIIPKKAIAKVADASLDDQALLGHLMLVAGKVAKQLGVEDAFRLIVNNGEGAGQTVFHLHIHLLAGRAFAEGSLAG